MVPLQSFGGELQLYLVLGIAVLVGVYFLHTVVNLGNFVAELVGRQ